MPIASAESCDITTKLISQTSRSHLNGTNGCGTRDSILQAYKSNNLILADKLSSSILHSKQTRGGLVNRPSWTDHGNSHRQRRCPKTPEAMRRRQRQARRRESEVLWILPFLTRRYQSLRRSSIRGNKRRAVVAAVAVRNGSRRHGPLDQPRNLDSVSLKKPEQ
jgi:hypothetical protein